MTVREQFILDVEWHTDMPLPRLVGPFTSVDEAREWARLNAPNGTWTVRSLAYPYLLTEFGETVTLR